MRRLVVVLLICAGVLCVCISGFVGYKLWQSRHTIVELDLPVRNGSDKARQRHVDDTPQVSDVAIEGTHLPLAKGWVPDPAFMRRAPAFAATTFEGVEVTVLPGDGSGKVIGFYAHWCTDCQRELSRIGRWMSNNQPFTDVDVIIVSTAVDQGRDQYPPSAWFAEKRLPVDVVRDSDTNEIGKAYGVSELPYIVAIDADGRVVARIEGTLTDQTWENLLQAATVRRMRLQ